MKLTAPVIIVCLVVVGSLAVLGAVLVGAIHVSDTLGAGFVLTTIGWSLVSCLNYAIGSSHSSRAKDDILERVILSGPAPPAPVPSVAPATPQAPVPPTPQKPQPLPAAANTKTWTGKMSTFGGPQDTGMGEDEGLALCEPGEVGKFPDLFLPGGGGLGRRLDPSKLYVACRWAYGETPRAWLQAHTVTLTANGKSIQVQPIDWGPAASTGRVADLSPSAAAALGLKTNDTVTVVVPLPTSVPPVSNKNGSVEPAWLTWARGEIGFHETGDNQGIGKYIALAHCGAEGDPWCSIFANAALEASGVTGTRSAMAQSFASSPRFTKLAGPRIGALAVFWRGSPSAGTGHVGFYTGDASTEHINVLGGNEDDQVEIKALPTNSATFGLLGYWWPATTTPASEPKVT